MKNKTIAKVSLSVLTCAVLAGCGGGSSETDNAPTVSVSASVALKEGRSANIVATATDDKQIASYQWSQVSGPTLTLTNTTAATVGVTAPAVSSDSDAVLRVTVTDSAGQTASANVTVNVANNRLPAVTASFDSAAEKSNVTLTAVATDEDGDIVSYNWQQISGEPLTLTGADSAELSFVAPNVTVDTDLIFSVTVTDDDAETVTIVGAVTITPVLTTYTITGTVNETAFANAQVSGELAGQSFSVTADAEGAFSLPLTADDDETNLFASITVKQAADTGVEFYKFVPSLTADSAQVAPLEKNNPVVQAVAASADDISNRVSINAVSTALYSLIIAANGGTAPENLDSFTLVEKAISPDELIEAAAVAQLVSQGGAFALPEGVTSILELLTNTETYNEYIAAAEAASPGIVTTTIDDIIADPELTEPVDETSLASIYFEVYPAANGFLSRGGNRFDFNSDGSGSETFSAGVHQFNWSLTDGKVQITYAESSGSTSFYAVGSGVLGLTQEQVDRLFAAGYFQVEVRQTPQNASMTRIIQGEKTDTYRIVSSVVRAMVPVTLPDSTVISTAPITLEVSKDALLRNADKLDDIKFTAAELSGDWVFEHYYFAGENGLGYANMFADVFAFNSDGTGSTVDTGKTFNWQLNDIGTVVVAFADGSSTEIIKLDQLDTDIQVFSASYDAQGNLVAADADYALKLDGSDFKTYNLSNIESRYWNTTINAWFKEAWNNDVLLWSEGINYFGWQLLASGEGYQMGSTVTAPPVFEPLFNARLAWETEDISDTVSVVNLNRSVCWDDQTQACTVRTWRLVKSGQGILGPRMYVLEVQRRRDSSTSPWAVQNGLGPRLNIYEEIAFEYWNDTAQTTNDATLAISQSLPAVASGKKQPAVRTILEPNIKVNLTQ